MTSTRYSTDYTGRKVDLSIFTAFTTGNAEAGLGFPETPTVTAGPEKAVQQWITAFLTRKGTVEGDPDYGTDFMTLVRTSQLQDEIQVQQAFTEAVQTLQEYLNFRLTGEELDDEVVVAAELMDGWGFTDGRSRLTLPIKLTLRSGRPQQIIIPVPVVFV